MWPNTASVKKILCGIIFFPRRFNAHNLHACSLGTSAHLTFSTAQNVWALTGNIFLSHYSWTCIISWQSHDPGATEARRFFSVASMSLWARLTVHAPIPSWCVVKSTQNSVACNIISLLLIVWISSRHRLCCQKYKSHHYLGALSRLSWTGRKMNALARAIQQKMLQITGQGDIHALKLLRPTRQLSIRTNK